MSIKHVNLHIRNENPEWLTIREAVKKSNGIIKINESDIYRYALQGAIRISIYF
ncbi:hypothetical protein [Pectobacterium atrosepticum]|uniref:hypothetical protein n=1 Tax=Pectobacterium atrosepticum TaxID=29471 RepID=UPI0026C4B5CD|nr:hypothetical protein [Pectobacterium atrosepticum]